jgi:hypothetical protein
VIGTTSLRPVLDRFVKLRKRSSTQRAVLLRVDGGGEAPRLDRLPHDVDVRERPRDQA